MLTEADSNPEWLSSGANYDAGYAAFATKRLEDNPNLAGSEEEFDWELGWKAAAEDAQRVEVQGRLPDTTFAKNQEL